MDVSREDLVRFARRDWAAVAEAKTQHWLGKKRRTPAHDLWRVSDDLRRFARIARPEGPSLAERLADLAVHRRVRLALRAVTSATR